MADIQPTIDDLQRDVARLKAQAKRAAQFEVAVRALIPLILGGRPPADRAVRDAVCAITEPGDLRLATIAIALELSRSGARR